MSASETKFASREIVELISQTKLGEFGIFMSAAVKANYDPVDITCGIESNFAATLILFVDHLPEDRRESVCKLICENVRDWTVNYLKNLRSSQQEAPSQVAAE